MTNLFTQGLLIAAIGMGLVFLALILLWGLMALLVSIRFKSDSKSKAAETLEEPAPAAIVEADESGMSSLRMRAAAAAVATALGLRVRAARALPPAPKSLSPWQVASRSSQFSKNSAVTSRKPRGFAR